LKGELDGVVSCDRVVLSMNLCTLL